MPIRFNTYGGLSRGDKRGKDGSYIYGENIDNISDPECMQLSKKPVSILSGISEKIERVIYCESNNKTIYISKNKIYEIGNSTPLFEFGKPPFSHKGGSISDIQWSTFNENSEGIFSTAFFTEREFFFISGNIELTLDETKVFIDMGSIKAYKMYISDLFSGNYELQIDNNPASSYTRFGSGAENILDLGGDFYIANNSLWHLKSTLELQIKSFIGKEKAIIGSGNGYSIYTEDKMLLWGGKDKRHSSLYDLGVNIQKVVSKGGTDYLFCDEGLFFLNGIKASPLYKTTFSSYMENKKFEFDFSVKSNFVLTDDLIWCIENNGESGKKICTFGNKEAGYPMSYTVFHIADNYEEVYYMEKKGKGVLISYKDKNGTYGVDYYSYNNEERQDKGFIMHREYVNDTISTRKKSQTIKIYSSELKENDSIKISYSINNQNFQEFKILTKDSTCKNGLYELTGLNYEFHKIVFKVEITGNTKLYDFIFYEK